MSDATSINPMGLNRLEIRASNTDTNKMPKTSTDIPVFVAAGDKNTTICSTKWTIASIKR